MSNEVWRLARKPPAGWPVAEDFHWQLEDIPEPGPDQMLTRTLYLSLDALACSKIARRLARCHPSRTSRL